MDEPNILIKTALDEAVQKVNAGITPTEALKKVAADFDLNPNYIQRTGEALNVALHYNHFKTAADRSVEFEIADIPRAIQESFTFNEKTAAETIAEQFSCSDANDTIFNYNRIISNPIYKQAFLEIAGASETEEYFPTTLNTVYEKSANYVQNLNKIADEADVQKTSAEIELNDLFSTLAQEFRKEAAARVSFEEFESQVFSKHGSSALPYLDLLHKTSCAKEERGVHDSSYIMFNPSKQAMLFDDLMDAAAAFIETEKRAQEARETLKFESGYLREALNILGKKAEDKKEEILAETKETKEEENQEKSEPEEEDPVMLEVKKKASDTNYIVGGSQSEDPVLEEVLQKQAFAGLGGFGGLGNFVSDLVNPAVSEAFADSVKAPTPLDIERPNQTLANMERKLLLQELIITDPILSKINPAKVARAYEQLLRLSPQISKEKEVVRAELRAMVSSQALSKFDADLFAKTDASMLKRQVGTTLYHKGNIKAFRL